MIQNIAIAELFTIALGYIIYKLIRQFTARTGCDKGCGGSCQKIEIPHKIK